jgi:hypothetical protein
MITMIILKGRGNYLDNKSGGNGLKGTIIRFLSKNARNCDKGRRGEDIIVDVLQRLDDSCYLINDIVLPSSKGNIDHVLITPKGIFAIETKHWEGEIVCHGDEWHRRYHKGLFSTKNFDSGSPSRQVKMNAFNLCKLMETRLFHNTFRIWVEGLVVFTNPRVHLELHDPSITVLKAYELYNYLDNLRPIAQVSNKDIRSIANFVANL